MNRAHTNQRARGNCEKRPTKTLECMEKNRFYISDTGDPLEQHGEREDEVCIDIETFRKFALDNWFY